MNTRNVLVAPACALALALASGCAHRAAVPPPAVPAETTSAPSATNRTPDYHGNGVSVSGEILAACKIDLGSVDRAPKFDFDQSLLLDSDRAVLDKVAQCVTTGPLAGRELRLVGRADPRGDVEYNFLLGEHRANSVERYLEALGVSHQQMIETSRGKLDATGTDEAGWQRDRRVDLLLD